MSASLSARMWCIFTSPHKAKRLQKRHVQRREVVAGGRVEQPDAANAQPRLHHPMPLALGPAAWPTAHRFRLPQPLSEGLPGGEADVAGRCQGVFVGRVAAEVGGHEVQIEHLRGRNGGDTILTYIIYIIVVNLYIRYKVDRRDMAARLLISRNWQMHTSLRQGQSD